MRISLDIASRIKSAADCLLGPTRVRSIAERLGGRRPFSEADLIASYFDANPRRGVMIDVGAHFGESLLPYLRRGWVVHAFEPDARNRAELLRRVPPSTHLHLHDVAVSDQESDAVPFFASDESDGISSLSAFRPTHREVQRVNVSTLSRVLAAGVLSRVDYLKIDAEGHDLFVLRGFPWERLTPEVVVAEFEDGKTRSLGYDYQTLGQFLVDCGYLVFLSEWHPIVRYGGPHQWRRIRQYPCSLQDSRGWGNFVAVRTGSDLKGLHSYLGRFRSEQSRDRDADQR